MDNKTGHSLGPMMCHMMDRLLASSGSLWDPIRVFPPAPSSHPNHFWLWKSNTASDVMPEAQASECPLTNGWHHSIQTGIMSSVLFNIRQGQKPGRGHWSIVFGVAEVQVNLQFCKIFGSFSEKCNIFKSNVESAPKVWSDERLHQSTHKVGGVIKAVLQSEVVCSHKGFRLIKITYLASFKPNDCTEPAESLGLRPKLWIHLHCFFFLDWDP